MAGRFPQLIFNILYVDLLPLSAIPNKKGLILPWGRTDMAMLPSQECVFSWQSLRVWNILMHNPDRLQYCHSLQTGKGKCTLVQELRLCTGRTAHRGSRGIALLFLDRGTRKG
jgi:hypothetical protein